MQAHKGKSRSRVDNKQMDGRDEDRKQRTANQIANNAFVARLLEHHSERETPLIDNARD